MDRTEAFALYAIFRDFAKQINALTDAVGAGVGGTPGAQGQAGAALFMLADPPEPEFQLPGPTGQAGASGGTGAQGPIGPPVYLEAEQGPEGDMGPRGLPGADGAPGAQGQPGPALFMLAQDGEPGEPGAPGTIGVNGAAGSPGAQGPAGPALFLLEDPPDPEIAWPGPTGAAGPAGSATDPFVGAYSPGSFTIATEKYAVLSRRLKLTTTQRLTVAGTGALRIT